MSNKKSMEDYLESILVLRKQTGSCRSVDLAAYMNFSKPSISIAMSKLQASGHVERTEDGQLYLTPWENPWPREPWKSTAFSSSF